MVVAAKKKEEKPVSVDEQFLRDYVARGGKAQVLDSGESVDQENLTEFLREVGEGDNGGGLARVSPGAEKEKMTPDERAAAREVARVERLQERAEKLKAANEERLVREQKREDQRLAAEAQKKQEAEDAKRLSQRQRMQKAAGNAAHQLGASVQPAMDKVSSLHTIGGVGLLVGVLMILLFVVVPVNAAGDTRLKQIWAMLNGNAHLQGRVVPTGNNGQLVNQQTTGNGASGQFGGGGPILYPAAMNGNGNVTYRTLTAGDF